MIVNGGGFPLTYSQISADIQNKKRPLFIQPFNLFFLYYDLHVMIYFEGHNDLL